MSVYREWEKWLKGGDQHLSITFESESALQHQDAVFIMPLHPLVKQAAMATDTKKPIFTSLRVYSKIIPEGKYEFAIYQWQYHGIREDLVLQPVAFSESITEHLLELLEKAESDSSGKVNIEDNSLWNGLDSRHHKLWSDARTVHQQRTQELARYRRESLATSHKARISLLNEQLNQATNDKIQKMRQSQIDAAEVDYARHSQELDIAMERADITAKTVADGIIQVAENN